MLPQLIFLYARNPFIEKKMNPESVATSNTINYDMFKSIK